MDSDEHPAFTLDGVYPWGRNAREYERMFGLCESDLGRRIVGCGDGPASYNAEWTARGGSVVSCDPLYQFSAEQIQERVEATYDSMVALMRNEPERFTWRDYDSPEAVGRSRLDAMAQFLTDLPRGLNQGRYLEAALPSLPLEDDAFDLALCSHFLLLYSDRLSLEFHQAAVEEMLRVAPEARVFPVLGLDGRDSRYLTPLMEWCRASGYEAEVRRVDYEFQVGGDRMLRVSRRFDPARAGLDTGPST